MSYGKVVLDYGDCILRESDMSILKKHEWLNDAIIGFYFEYLGNQCGDGSHLKFFSPEVTQLLKLIPSSEEVQCILGDVKGVNYSFWPVNDSSETEKGSSGSHWSLLVFSRPDNKFLHFDSYGGSNEAAARRLFQKLAPLFPPNSSFQDFEGCNLQANGRDCGLHVIRNAKLIADFVDKHDLSNLPEEDKKLWKNGLTTATPKQAEDMRTHLVMLINSLIKHPS